MTSNTLIAFFSRKGFNYVNGSIINLPVGNTEVIARKIQLLTGGGSNLFQILPENPYPEYYTETTTLAQKELRENARPDFAENSTTWPRTIPYSSVIPTGGEQCPWLCSHSLNSTTSRENASPHFAHMKVADWEAANETSKTYVPEP